MPHTTIHGFDIEYKPRVFMEALTLQKAIFTLDQKLQDFVILQKEMLLYTQKPTSVESFKCQQQTLKKQINYTNLQDTNPVCLMLIRKIQTARAYLVKLVQLLLHQVDVP